MAKRTKIICTLGPAVDSVDAVTQLIEAGMDIARLNFSHGKHSEHLERINRLKQARAALDAPCALMLDTRGPEIRTGALVDARPVMLETGASLILIEEEVAGTAACITQTCKGLAEHVSIGTAILIDDGLIELAVDRIEKTAIHCTVKNSGLLGERKSINVPGVFIPLPAMTDQDRADLSFGIQQGVDFIAASFVRSAADVREIRAFLNSNGGDDLGIIAKIECENALDDIEAIIDESDGIMVARGDLGVEIPAFKVPHLQKKIIDLCNKRSTPVITATQMLDSMMRNPRPTRAEVGDVANAIYDGTDCLMLSGETAIGAYPLEAVSMMARVAEASEGYLSEKDTTPLLSQDKDHCIVSLAVGSAAVKTAEALNARCIVAPTLTGRSARLISSLRPRKPIYAPTPSESVMRSMQLYWGVIPFLSDVRGDTDYVIGHAQQDVLRRNLVADGDIAVFTVGNRDTSPQAQPGQSNPTITPANIMYVVEIHEDSSTQQCKS